MPKPQIDAMNLQALSELMTQEDLAYRKYCSYVSMATDETLKQKLGALANNHRQRFDALLAYLNSHE